LVSWLVRVVKAAVKVPGAHTEMGVGPRTVKGTDRLGRGMRRSPSGALFPPETRPNAP
jgi:hypothetical protein